MHSAISPPQHWLLKNNQTVTVNPRYVCNSIPALIHAAIQGLGCAYFSNDHVQSELAEGRLQEILCDYAPAAFPIYICFQKQDVIPKKVRIFTHHLQHALIFP